MTDNTPPCKCNIAEIATVVQESTSDNPYWVLLCKHGAICVRTPTLLVPK